LSEEKDVNSGRLEPDTTRGAARRRRSKLLRGTSTLAFLPSNWAILALFYCRTPILCRFSTGYLTGNRIKSA